MALANEGEPVAETLLSRCARPRPRLVCVDGRVVGDAVVVVSEEDPNWWRGITTGPVPPQSPLSNDCKVTIGQLQL
jgi:hypothetical protein